MFRSENEILLFPEVAPAAAFYDSCNYCSYFLVILVFVTRLEPVGLPVAGAAFFGEAALPPPGLIFFKVKVSPKLIFFD